MPIYEQSYRHWTGVLNPRTPGWLVIARAEIRLRWQRWMILLVIVSSLPFVVRASQVYIVTRLCDIPQLAAFAGQFEVNPAFFADFLLQQSALTILVVILAGSGLIANDRKYGALQIYFSRPVTRRDYIVGKFAVIAFYCSLVTLIPALFLFLIKILLSEDLGFLGQYYWVPFSILACGGCMILIYGTLILALSSLGKGSRFAGIGFFIVIALTDLAGGILRSTPNAAAISLGSDLRRVGDFLFRLPPSHSFPVTLAAGILAAVFMLSLYILIRNVKGTEVIS